MMVNNLEVRQLLQEQIERLGVSPNHLGEEYGVKVIDSEESLYGIELCSEICGTVDLQPKETIENLRLLSSDEGDKIAIFWKNVTDSQYAPTA